MSEHALLSASGSHKWLNCPASIKMESGLPDTTSEAATYGSQAHALAEMCLLQDINTAGLLNQHIYADDLDFIADEEMCGGVQIYLDYVRNVENIDTMHIEKRLDYSTWVPDGFGTSDCLIVHSGDDEGLVSVIDLKFGTGVQVDAENNTQAMLYGLGALHQYGGERFRLVIVQPRLNHISEWFVSKEDLLHWATTVASPQAHLALSDNPPFNPSPSTCQFCQAKGFCKALMEFSMKQLFAEFESVSNPGEIKERSKLTNAEIGEIIPYLKSIKQWSEAVQKYAFTELMNGLDVPGHKIVAGNNSRVWKDEVEAEEALLEAGLEKSDIYPVELVSPAQAEKLINKKDPLFTEQVKKIPGNPLLAPLSNKKEAINVNFADDFKDFI